MEPEYFKTLRDVVHEIDTQDGPLENNSEDNKRKKEVPRAHERYSFRTPCRICFFGNEASCLRELPGMTRNLSQGGLSVVVKRVFNVGEPVEIRLALPGGENTCMAGTVAFCRYISRACHEIGIRLYIVRNGPIFFPTHNRAQALRAIGPVSDGHP